MLHAEIKAIDRYWSDLVMEVAQGDASQYMDIMRMPITDFYMVLESNSALAEKMKDRG